jgi:hypothetical protein
MRKIIFLFTFFSAIILETGFSFIKVKPLESCATHSGSCTTCDSIRKLFHDDVIVLVAKEVLDSTSPYYDSLFLPEKLISEYENAMIAFYNGVPDSLTMGKKAYVHVDPQAIPDYYAVQIIVKKPEYKKWLKSFPGVGNKSIDSLFAKTHLTNSIVPVIGNTYAAFNYKSNHLLNAPAINRALSKIKNTTASLSKANSFFYSPGMNFYRSPMLSVKQIAEGFEIGLAIDGKGMPPELPMTYTIETFLVRQDCTVKYVSTTIGR